MEYGKLSKLLFTTRSRGFKDLSASGQWPRRVEGQVVRRSENSKIYLLPGPLRKPEISQMLNRLLASDQIGKRIWRLSR